MVAEKPQRHDEERNLALLQAAEHSLQAFKAVPPAKVGDDLRVRHAGIARRLAAAAQTQAGSMSPGTQLPGSPAGAGSWRRLSTARAFSR